MFQITMLDTIAYAIEWSYFAQQYTNEKLIGSNENLISSTFVVVIHFIWLIVGDGTVGDYGQVCFFFEKFLGF